LIPHWITSPFTTGPTFSGVPEKMMSPGRSSNADESRLICSATVQIMLERFEFCLT